MSCAGFLLIATIEAGGGAVTNSGDLMFRFVDAYDCMILGLVVAATVDADGNVGFLSTVFNIMSEAVTTGAGAEQRHGDVGFGSGAVAEHEGGLFDNGFEKCAVDIEERDHYR